MFECVYEEAILPDVTRHFKPPSARVRRAVVSTFRVNETVPVPRRSLSTAMDVYTGAMQRDERKAATPVAIAILGVQWGSTLIEP